MIVQKSADTAPSLPDPLHFLGAKPIEPIRYYAMGQRRPVKYSEGHTSENPQTTYPVFIAIGSKTAVAFYISNVESSTLPIKIDEELSTTFKSTLQMLEENIMINAEDSEVFFEFNTLFMKYGDDAIYLLQDLITRNEINSIFAGKLLKHIGSIANNFPINLFTFTWMLENFLNSKKIAIRNSAVLGLSYVNNPKTIPAIKKALEVEPIPEIKRNINQVLDQLINKK